jgi:hypothetical protein
MGRAALCAGFMTDQRSASFSEHSRTAAEIRLPSSAAGNSRSPSAYPFFLGGVLP